MRWTREVKVVQKSTKHIGMRLAKGMARWNSPPDWTTRPTSPARYRIGCGTRQHNAALLVWRNRRLSQESVASSRSRWPSVPCHMARPTVSMERGILLYRFFALRYFMAHQGAVGM